MRRISGTCNSTRRVPSISLELLIMTKPSCWIRRSGFSVFLGFFIYFRGNFGSTYDWRLGTWLAIATAWQRMGGVKWDLDNVRITGNMGHHTSTIEYPWRPSSIPPSRSHRSCRNFTAENTRICHFFRPHLPLMWQYQSHSAPTNELRHSYDEKRHHA